MNRHRVFLDTYVVALRRLHHKERRSSTELTKRLWDSLEKADSSAIRVKPLPSNFKGIAYTFEVELSTSGLLHLQKVIEAGLPPTEGWPYISGLA